MTGRGVERLSEIDLDLLASLREGGTIAGYARDHHYSPHWPKWKSRSLRQRFGVTTIEEVLLMSDDDQGVSRGDFDKLFGAFTKLSDTVEELAKRPNDPAAQQQVRDRELDVKDHAKALGLSLEDVEKLKDEKEFGKFKAMQDRLDKERLEAEAEEDEDDSANGGGKTLGEKVRDGLGGISGVKQQ